MKQKYLILIGIIIVFSGYVIVIEIDNYLDGDLKQYTKSQIKQDGISNWTGTPEGFTGKNFDKCMITKGSKIKGDPLICYMSNGTSYQINE